MVVVGTLAALGSNVLELRDDLTGGGSIAATSDLVLTIAFIALFGFFAEMMRKGRQWGRVFLTVFASLGLIFNVFGLFDLGGRPIDGTAQVVLASIGSVASIAGVLFMFLPSANTFFRDNRERARTVSQGLRKLMLTAHVAVSVGWLGLIMGMLAMAVTAAISSDPRTQFSVYSMMSLLDEIFLGMTSLFALLTGMVGAVGTKWHLMRRHWVSVKFVVTVVLMMFGFGVIHQLIAEAYALVLAGAPPAQVREVGVPLAVCAGVAVLTLIFMTVLSTYKPWGLTRYGRRQQATGRPASPVSSPRPAEQADRFAAVGRR